MLKKIIYQNICERYNIFLYIQKKILLLAGSHHKIDSKLETQLLEVSIVDNTEHVQVWFPLLEERNCIFFQFLGQVVP